MDDKLFALIGRGVWYTPGPDDVFADTFANARFYPGIITRAWGGNKMDLVIFCDGSHSRFSVDYSPEAKLGTWRWPETVK